MVDVHPATDADRAPLGHLQRATLAEPWPDLLDLATGEGGPRCLVADDGEPVGYVVAVTAGHPDAYVPELAVAPERQREGIGSTLLRTLVADLTDAGFDRVRLTARVDDGGVQAFYRDRGFETVETVADHFESGDGVVLERQL